MEKKEKTKVKAHNISHLKSQNYSIFFSLTFIYLCRLAGSCSISEKRLDIQWLCTINLDDAQPC